MGEEMQRKTPVHFPVYEKGNLSSIVFLTVCTKDRKPILAHDDVHDVLLRAWRDAGEWSVGRYVIMPNHIHLFCGPAKFEYPSLMKWVKYWKTVASRHWPRPDEHPVWQVDSWDRQLRRGESYSTKWEYVAQNPVRHGLVLRADDWKHQGEMNVLPWHDP
jgi:putative transposase